ncbi:S1C family serine protease [Coprothermobacter platensis]|uniref:S1C family serine protease n=1 Tax=Coprothermobacter platensis TaxID=108819 RepID=UPI0003611C73|nr:trypsin-like peptidase domain-containing protein [Coprothermobacter platensis]
MEGFYEEPQVEGPKTPKKRNSWLRSVTAILVIAVMLFASGFVGYTYGYNQKPAVSSSPVAVTTSYTSTSSISDLQSQIETVAAEASDAVVNIQTESMSYNFFYQPVPSEGLGSGFFISSDGYILTNNHVIDGASNITVITRDGKKYSAKVVGSDQLSDLAVLKINVSGVKYLTFRSTDSTRVGEFVLAIGNPLGLSYSVTFGVLSAKERSIEEDNGALVVDMLQTDAAINPGNSGGPLLDLSGKVVGINTAISTEGQGIGFAVSGDTAVKVINDIMKNGYVKWAYLGVVTQDATKGDGVNVVNLDATGPAYKAGIKVGDKIVAIDGKTVTSQEDLNSIIRKHNPGDTITITLQRSGQTLKISVTLGERPQS